MARSYDLADAAHLLDMEEKAVKKAIRYGKIKTAPRSGREIFISENEIARYTTQRPVSWSIAEIESQDAFCTLVQQKVEHYASLGDRPVLVRLYDLGDKANCPGIIVIGDLQRDIGFRKYDVPAESAREILLSLKSSDGSPYVPASQDAVKWHEDMENLDIFDFCWIGLSPAGRGTATAIEYAFTRSDWTTKFDKWSRPTQGWDTLEARRRDGSPVRDYVEISELDYILGDDVLRTWPLLNEHSELENSQFMDAINDVEREVWQLDPYDLYLSKNSIQTIKRNCLADDPHKINDRDSFFDLAHRAIYDLLAAREQDHQVPDYARWKAHYGLNVQLWHEFNDELPLDERLDKLAALYPHDRNHQWQPEHVIDALVFAKHALSNVDEYSGEPDLETAAALRHTLDVIAVWYAQRFDSRPLTLWWTTENLGKANRMSALLPETKSWIDEGLPVREPKPDDNSRRARNWRALNMARQEVIENSGVKSPEVSLILDNKEGVLFFTDSREATVWF